MLSQLLFGERVRILSTKKNDWVQVETLYDGVIGWMDRRQLYEVPTSSVSDQPAVCIDIAEAVFCDGDSTYVTIGAEFDHYDGMIFRIADHVYRYSGQAAMGDSISPSYALIEKLAKKLLNAPSLAGGRSPFGVDPAGLVQIVFKCIGVALERTAAEQVHHGETVDFWEAAQPGDLAFFCEETDQISHVGIVLENHNVIHAAGRVRIDKMDHYGIFNLDIQQYTHRLKIVKRIL